MPQKKNNKKESDDQTFRDVQREMAKPRIAKSVRQAAVQADTDEPSKEGQPLSHSSLVETAKS